MRTPSVIILSLTLGFASGCSLPFGGGGDDELDRLERVRAAKRLKLYRPLKVALRSLPPPQLVNEAVEALGPPGSRKHASTGEAVNPGSREFWKRLARDVARRDPRFEALQSRVGLFALALSLRTVASIALMAALVPARLGIAILFGHAGIWLATPITAVIGTAWLHALDNQWIKLIFHPTHGLSPTEAIGPAVLENPFGSGVRESLQTLYEEIGLLAAEDEDRYPGAFSGFLELIRKSRAGIPDGHMIFRLDSPHVEHALLGISWTLAGQPKIAMYELDRVDVRELEGFERVAFHAARTKVFLAVRCPRHALREIGHLESSIEGMKDETEDSAAADLGHAVLDLTRYQILEDLGRPEATDALERMTRRVQSRPMLAPFSNLVAGHARLKALDLEGTRRHLSLALEAFREDPLAQDLIRRLIEQVKAGDSTGSRPEILDSASLILLSRISRVAVGPEALESVHGLREGVATWIQSWLDRWPDATTLKDHLSPGRFFPAAGSDPAEQPGP